MHITKLKEANRYDFIEISDEFYKTVLKIQEEDEKNTKTIIQKRNKLRGLK
jgi:hypothetical protein